MIGERIKQVRKEKKLSQAEFGESVNLSGSQIGCYEKGIRQVTERAINDICRVFNIEPLWLTTGEGDMFMQSDEDDAIIELMNKALLHEDEFLRDLFMSFAKLDVEHWKALKELMDTYVDIQNNKK